MNGPLPGSLAEPTGQEVRRSTSTSTRTRTEVEVWRADLAMRVRAPLLFTAVARARKVTLTDDARAFLRQRLGDRPLTGSDVESILVRAKERAVLALRDNDLQPGDLEAAVDSFIDPLDPALLALQELAAVLSCSDRRYLPERYRDADRAALLEQFDRARVLAARRL